MRRGNDNELLFTSDINNPERDPAKRVKSGTFMGFNLGAGFCSEHEWGIKRISESFQLDRITHKSGKVVGLPDVKRYGGGGLIFVKSKSGKTAVLMFREYWNKESVEALQTPMTDKQLRDTVSKYTSGELQLREAVKMSTYGRPADTLATAWDEGSFGILVAENAGLDMKVSYLEHIYEASKKGDLGIWVGGRGVFQNGGLCVVVHSTLPDSLLKAWKEAYEDAEKMKAEFAASGIEKKLQDAGKKWHYLGPKRCPNMPKDRPTAYNFLCWLNPYDQDKINCGWFTVEELELWVKNEGPVPKSKEQLEKQAADRAKYASSRR